MIAMPEPRSRLDALEATIVVEPEEIDGADQNELITDELLAEHNA
ncbi:MAG: hypothetical protein ACOYLK_18505 [Sphingomonas sp.]